MKSKHHSRVPIIMAFLLSAGLLSLFFGCVTGKGGEDQYRVGGVQYGVTEGRFRGRWWNYYERGRSYNEGGFYAEAERDLKQALKGRSRDQRWPRTYGLHFTPEYFPHRELGIAQWKQGDLKEGLQELELSMAQQYSARCAWYLGEVRRQWLEQEGGDTEAPRLEMLAPEAGVPVGATQVMIRGVARDDRYVSSVSVNGVSFDVKVSAPEVPFESQVLLRPGQNDVEIRITDLLGKEKRLRIPVESDVDGPAVSFDEPLTLPGRVQGVVMDRSGIAVLRIAGRSIPLETTSEGFSTFNASLSAADLEAIPYFECEDTLGNITRERVPVDRLQLSALPADHPFAQAAPLLLASSRPQQVFLGQHLTGLLVQGQLQALAVTPPDSGEIRVDMDLEQGQEYFMDDIVVALNIKSSEPLDTISLNGDTIDVIPRRKSVSVSRKVHLQQGPNNIVARAKDIVDTTVENKKEIHRKANDFEVAGNKLSITFLNNVVRIQHPALADKADYILDTLANIRQLKDRFTVVDRSLMAEALAEQELSTLLSSRKNKLNLGQHIAAELMLSLRLREDEETVSINLDGISTETGVWITQDLGVTGPKENRDALIDTLALRLVQEFPRVQGLLMDWDSPEITFDITKKQGIQEFFKCLVFKTKTMVHPTTKKEFHKPVVLGEGTIHAVGDDFSSAKMYSREEGQDVSALPIEVGQYVLIK